MSWYFDPLPVFAYDLIMIDPPWRYRLRSKKGEGKSPQRHYKTMSMEEVAALPVGHLAKPDAALILWCTWPLLLDGGEARRRLGDSSYSPIGAIIKKWGFRYVTGGTWHKKTRHGATAFGTGYRARSACEPFLIAVQGSPTTSRSLRNLIEGARREHSSKPEEAYDWCERYMPHARRADIFSRRNRPGWDSWGDEIGKFDEAA